MGEYRGRDFARNYFKNNPTDVENKTVYLINY